MILCSWTEAHTHTHTSELFQVYLLCSFFFFISCSLTRFNETLYYIIDARFSHNYCHGMCKLGKMCKQMTFLLCFCLPTPPSICHPYDKFASCTILWCQRICDNFKNKMCGREKYGIDFMRAIRSMWKETILFATDFEFFSHWLEFYSQYKNTHAHKSSVIIPMQ